MGLLEKLKQFFVVEDEDELYRPLPEEGQNPTIRSKKRGTLVSLSNPRRFDLLLLEPATLAEAQDVGERLRNRCAVIVNLQHTDKDIALRIIDFISGITCALNGTAQKVTDWVFVFAPHQVEVMAPPLREKREKDKKEQLYFSQADANPINRTMP